MILNTLGVNNDLFTLFLLFTAFANLCLNYDLCEFLIWWPLRIYAWIMAFANFDLVAILQILIWWPLRILIWWQFCEFWFSGLSANFDLMAFANFDLTAILQECLNYGLCKNAWIMAFANFWFGGNSANFDLVAILRIFDLVAILRMPELWPFCEFWFSGNLRECLNGGNHHKYANKN